MMDITLNLSNYEELSNPDLGVSPFRNNQEVASLQDLLNQFDKTEGLSPSCDLEDYDDFNLAGSHRTEKASSPSKSIRIRIRKGPAIQPLSGAVTKQCSSPTGFKIRTIKLEKVMKSELNSPVNPQTLNEQLRKGCNLGFNDSEKSENEEDRNHEGLFYKEKGRIRLIAPEDKIPSERTFLTSGRQYKSSVVLFKGIDDKKVYLPKLSADNTSQMMKSDTDAHMTTMATTLQDSKEETQEGRSHAFSTMNDSSHMKASARFPRERKSAFELPIRIPSTQANELILDTNTNQSLEAGAAKTTSKKLSSYQYFNPSGDVRAWKVEAKPPGRPCTGGRFLRRSVDKMTITEEGI